MKTITGINKNPLCTKVLIFLIFGCISGYRLPGMDSNRIGVYGGTPIDILKVPFIAHYRPRLNDTPVYCGASIVDEQFLVSAAHCYGMAFYYDFENLMFVTVGTDKTSGGEDYEIAETFVHPDFSPDFSVSSFNADVIVLKLKTRIKFNDRVQPIKMADSNFVLKDGDVVTGIGFGKTENGKTSSELLTVDVPVVNQERCKNIYKEINYTVSDTMFCAGLDKEVGTCQGDSGGPIILNDILVGITSWGNGCASLKWPDVYSRVSALRSFIDETIKKNS